MASQGWSMAYVDAEARARMNRGMCAVFHRRISADGKPVTHLVKPKRIKCFIVGKHVEVSPADRIDRLVNAVKRELMSPPTVFRVGLVQLWYSDDLAEYMPEKTEDLTSLLSI
ncbi:hypothetical protein RI054_39g143650 [Pseudoscourfieldia marina]